MTDNILTMKKPGDEQPRRAGAKQVVVVGAGLAGLTAALGLSDAGAEVQIIEASTVPGGNAWMDDSAHPPLPTAGSCFRAPQKGDRIDRMLGRLGLDRQWRSTGSSMQVLFRTGALMANLHEVTGAFLRHPSWLLKPKVWGLTGGLFAAALTGRPLVPAEKALGEPIFADLYAFLARLSPGAGRFPAMPWSMDCGISRDEMEALDRMTIEEFLFDPKAVQDLPADLRPPRRMGRLVRLAVATTLEVEGLLLSNCSAYVGLHFLVGYLYGDLVALPGGNGAVSKAILGYLLERPTVTLRTGCRVVEVHSHAAGYSVTLRDGDRVETLTCDGVVIAAPKDAAAAMVPELSDAQRAAMQAIAYSDYAIVNARLTEPVWTDHFGGYFIGDRPERNARTAFCRAGGLVNASWSKLPGSRKRGGLTFLKPIAQREDQGRLEMTAPVVLEQEARAEVIRAMKAIGADPALLERVTLHRWPRGLVSPRPGQVAEDVFVQATMPFGAITFANQDSIGVGCLESAIDAGEQAARLLTRILDMASPDVAAKAQ
ncbi:FAD-dependent oxidoreductase [Sagittula sp. S175]|uniref:FAD-dependent oxidoreductase n=1 Tax=Sagittula sp. S175 TaxID=3415129 RepID=UPI003C7CCBC8